MSSTHGPTVPTPTPCQPEAATQEPGSVTAPPSGTRCGLDTVELARFERLLSGKTQAELERLFSPQELADAGRGPGRIGSLAARFAAKEACCKLFPRETALGLLAPADFAVQRDPFGAPRVKPGSDAQFAMDQHRVAEVRISLTHTDTSASAIAWTEPRHTEVPWFGRLMYHLLPYRRSVVLGNLRRVFGHTLPEPEIRRLAQAYCAHYLQFLLEFIRLPFMSAKARRAWVRVENIQAPLRAIEQGQGLILLTGHFGNFEVATVAGIGQFPEYHGKLHFIRRALKPRWLDAFVNRRFRRAGFGTLPKRGSLDQITGLLEQGHAIVCVFDQHASGKDGLVVDFFGHPASTFKNVALLALTTRAPVIPAYTWREPDGRHVLRFEDPLPLIECDNDREAIERNTRAYNAALERMLVRHPEQWIWMHRRWKGQRPGPAAGQPKSDETTA
jgi:phosphopantetheine--protein transferase-like protein